MHTVKGILNFYGDPVVNQQADRFRFHAVSHAVVEDEGKYCSLSERLLKQKDEMQLHGLTAVWCTMTLPI